MSQQPELRFPNTHISQQAAIEQLKKQRDKKERKSKFITHTHNTQRFNEF